MTVLLILSILIFIEIYSTCRKSLVLFCTEIETPTFLTTYIRSN
jgi:hypothetical protein